MVSSSSMEVLRDLAEKAVEDATRHLGKAQQTFEQAKQQLDKLMNYEQEYRHQLQQNMTSGGMESANWINYQQFINSLDATVSHHRQYVSQCQTHVNSAMHVWRQKKQRLNAFAILNERAAAARYIKENRRDQKLMDEFAQRASLKRESL